MTGYRSHTVWSDQIAEETNAAVGRAEAITKADRPRWKRIIRKLIGRSRSDSRAVSKALIDATGSINHNVTSLRSSLDVLERQAADLILGLDQVSRSNEKRRDEISDLADATSDLRVYLAESFRELSRRMDRLSVVNESLAESRNSSLGRSTDDLAKLSVEPTTGDIKSSSAGAAFDDFFYEELEKKFRGSRKDIKKSLGIYLPSIAGLPNGELPVLDVGCGRGEWLELLNENEMKAYGVDVSKLFVAENSQRGLDVRLADAVEHMQALEPNSLRAVTGFHIIEHLPLEAVFNLFKSAKHALASGGMVIFETPNPTNLAVGAATFHLDPTHLKPVHPLFAEFMAEAAGFSEVRLEYSVPVATFPEDEMKDLPHSFRILAESFWSAINGPQNFAVLATK